MVGIPIAATSGLSKKQVVGDKAVKAHMHVKGSEEMTMANDSGRRIESGNCLPSLLNVSYCLSPIPCSIVS